MLKNQMEDVYSNIPLEKIPWNMEIPPDILQEIIKTQKIKPCKVIELGCGTGNYVRYFSSRGFEATGVDFSKKAIEIAVNLAAKEKKICEFIVSDVLDDLSEVTDTYDFAFDWELLHHIFPENREKYINNVCRLLKPRGKYLSVSFSEKSPQFGGEGKYRRTPLNTVLYFSSEEEIELLVKPLFKILEIKTIEIKGKFAPHKAVYAFLEKRN
ncbi:class I SAM-dependent methyltransferase [Bacteroidota bacterium]